MDYWIRLGQLLLQATAAVFGLAGFVIAWIGRKERASKEALADVEKRLQAQLTGYETTQDSNHRSSQEALAALKERMAAIDEALKHVPTNSDITNLAQSVSLLATSVAELKGEVSGTTRTVERMNQFLMERA